MASVTFARRPAVAVDELRRAWGAIQAGQFRRNADSPGVGCPSRPAPPHSGNVWVPAPGEKTVAVVGAAGSVGASMVSLALGTTDPGPVRVIECCAPGSSGLAAASTAEFGLHPDGWRQGTRSHVLLERTGTTLAQAVDVPVPTAAAGERQLTILDVGWDLGYLWATDCWLASAVLTADAVVVVAAATIPGMRRLEATLELLDNGSAHVVLVGLRRCKLPKSVEGSAGPVTRRVLDYDRHVGIDEDRALAVAGVDSRELPDHLLSAAGRLHAACLPGNDVYDEALPVKGTPTHAND